MNITTNKVIVFNNRSTLCGTRAKLKKSEKFSCINSQKVYIHSIFYIFFIRYYLSNKNKHFMITTSLLYSFHSSGVVGCAVVLATDCGGEKFLHSGLNTCI